MQIINDDLAMTVNTTFYDNKKIALLIFIDMYVCFYIYFFISLPFPLLLFFLICFVTAPLNRAPCSRGAMLLLLYYYIIMKRIDKSITYTCVRSGSSLKAWLEMC